MPTTSTADRRGLLNVTLRLEIVTVDDGGAGRRREQNIFDEIEMTSAARTADKDQ